MTTTARTEDETREFEALIASVLDRAFGLAYHLTRSRDDAQDLIQTAALQAFRAFHQFTPGTNFKAWYFKILTRCFYAHYRKKRRQPPMTTLEDAAPLHLNVTTTGLGMHEQYADPAAEVLGRLNEEAVSRAIHALPEEFRVVCTMYFMQDASYQEIAEILECPIGTVRSRLHRGRRMLQRALWQLAIEQGIMSASVAAKEIS